MSEVYEGSKDRPVRMLLDLVEEGRIALPNFQRDYVWQPAATASLIASITTDFPIGSLLALRVDTNTQTEFLDPVKVKEAPDINAQNLEFLLLDGQQRLTSMYHALRGHGDYVYFVDFERLRAGEEFEDVVVSKQRTPYRLVDREEIAKLLTLEGQVASGLIPLYAIFGYKHGFMDWVLDASQFAADPEAFRQSMEDEFYKPYVRRVQDYIVPIIVLSPTTSNVALCTIFGTLNNTGTRLSVFDLMVAKLWAPPDQVRLKDLWKEALADNPVLTEYGVDKVHVLWALALLVDHFNPQTGENIRSCRKRDILELRGDHVAANWTNAIQGYVSAIDLLQEECGAVSPRLLPYEPMLVPMAALFARFPELGGTELRKMRAKLQSWYWASIFARSYTQGAQTKAAADFAQLEKWVLDDAAVPKVITEFRIDAEDLRAATGFSDSVFTGVVAMVMALKPEDFQDGKSIRDRVQKQHSVDVHHVFPDNWLRTNGFGGSEYESLRNSILNKTLIGATTNRRIKDRAPSVYLADIEQDLGSATLRSVLESHLMPGAAESSLRNDDFGAFVDERSKSLIELILANVAAPTFS